ncbi:MAG: glucose-6-phosphate dehydrogenase, partial [Azorhizobium sp. 12-66-6]
MVARVITVEPFDIVVFGATGDLAKRKLLPALFERDLAGQIPQDARIIGVSRRAMDGDEFRAFARDCLADRDGSAEARDAAAEAEALSRFLERLHYVEVDAKSDEGWDKLSRCLDSGSHKVRVFYLAVGPDLFDDICSRIGAHGLVTPLTRVVVEKPVGKNLASARAVNAAVGKVFPEESVFRIDHYLGKETVQNLMALRFANALFEPV